MRLCLSSILPLLLVPRRSPRSSPLQLTADDYARAERALAPNVAPLVSGLAGRPTWLADGRFWYRATAPNGSAFFIVDPARRTRESLFDATRLATALAAATGGRVDANRLPFQSFELAKDNRAIDSHGTQSTPGTATCSSTRCAPGDSTIGRRPAHRRTPASRPTASTAVYIKDYNLW